MKRNTGSSLVVILLIMVVGLTVGLYLMSRTTTDIAITTKITDSSRAFNAAEAGIEVAINNAAVSPLPVSISTGVAFTPDVIQYGAGKEVYPASPIETKVGDASTIWLANHDSSGNLTNTNSYNSANLDICINTLAVHPTIAVNLYYAEDPSLESIKSSYGVFSDSTNPKIDDKKSNECNSKYNKVLKLKIKNNNSDFGDISGYPIALKIRPIDINMSFGADPPGVSDQLPAQGSDITSTGTAGEATRKINVKNPYPVPPAFLDYALYSYGSITK